MAKMKTGDKIWIAGGVFAGGYLFVPIFRNIVDNFVSGFRKGWSGTPPPTPQTAGLGWSRGY